MAEDMTARTSQRSKTVYITKTKLLMLFAVTIARSKQMLSFIMLMLNAYVKLLLDSSCEGRVVLQVSEDLHPPCVRSK
jgi:hypothetical protein